jgi:AraC-like DNA-binding protein
VLKGTFVLTVKNRSYLLAPDDLVFISPFMDHYDSYYRENEPYEVLWIFERNLKRTTFVHAVYYGQGSYSLAHRAGARNANLEHQLLGRIFDLRSVKQNRFKEITGILGKLFVSYQDRLKEEMRIRSKNRILYAISPADMERMTTVAAYLLRQTKERNPIRELAIRFSLSVDQLEKLYRKVHGESIKQMLIRRKLEQAIDLMRTGTLNITNICERTGFENPLYFSRIFKQYCGLSPSAYQDKFIKSMR